MSQPGNPLPGWGLHVTRLEKWNCPKALCRERAPTKSEISLQSTPAHTPSLHCGARALRNTTYGNKSKLGLEG